MQYLIAMLVCITALASFINYKFMHLPKVIGLTLITLGLSGILMILLAIGQFWVTPLKTFLTGIDFSRTVINGMLSFLLFASALHINALELSAHKKVVATLATLSVFISCILIGLSIWWLASLLGIEIPLIYTLLFGALIAPTDAICVIGALKQTLTPKAIRMKITGESLFNDAAGIVLFVLILEIAHGAHDKLHLPSILFLLAREGLGGLLLGYVLGKATSYFLKQLNHDETAILLTLALVTGGYSIAMALHVSGPICMVLAGLIVGNHCRSSHISQSTVFRLYQFWHLVDDILNSFLFVMIGLEILSIHTGWIPFGIGVLAFFIILGVRMISVAGPLLILEPLSQFSWKVLSVMTWGGMRGGLSVALALAIPQGEHKSLIVSITYSVVVLSIILQGLTLRPLIQRLYPTPAPHA